MWALPTSGVQWTHPLHAAVLVCPPISVVPMMLAYCCPGTYLHSCIPTMSHTPRFSQVRHPYHFLSLLSYWSLVYICGPGLCSFSALVCDQLPRRLFHGSPKAHCQRVSQPQSWRALLGGHRRAAAKGLQQPKLPCATWLRPNFGIFPISQIFDLRPPQVVQTPTCDSSVVKRKTAEKNLKKQTETETTNFSSKSKHKIDLRPPQVEKQMETWRK